MVEIGERVLVLGCAGAGKTVFAQRLAMVTGLPLVTLDREYWQPGWTEPDKQHWAAKVEALITAPCWIMDGNYLGTLPLRLARADTVVFLDLPRSVWPLARHRQNPAKLRSDTRRHGSGLPGTFRLEIPRLHLEFSICASDARRRDATGFSRILDGLSKFSRCRFVSLRRRTGAVNRGLVVQRIYSRGMEAVVPRPTTTRWWRRRIRCVLTSLTPSWPGLSRPSTSWLIDGCKDVDARHKPGHDG